LSQPAEKVVLISGGAAGIGCRIAEAFIAEGRSVHVFDASAENIDTFLAAHQSATATRADISIPGDVDQVFADLDSNYGRLDVLVNNAGIAGPTAAVQDISDADWEQCIAVDLNGPFYVTRRAVPRLLESTGGSIVNIASTAATHGFPLRSAYAAAKWALIGLTKTWAMELGPQGVRVNAVCPGSVEGERIDTVIERDAKERGVSADAVRDVYLKQVSMRRFVSADDIAAMVRFLASDEASTVSGQVIAVDGNTETLANQMS